MIRPGGFEDPGLMPTPEAQRRLREFMETARELGSDEFTGLVLLSLIIHLQDEAAWRKAIDDARDTLSKAGAA